jgi:beta-galactosidase/beta-glucuronidase
MESTVTDISEPHDPTTARSGALAVTASTGRHEISLDGTWSFRPGEESPERQIHVPGCWESQFSDLRGWAGSAYYERTFKVPQEFRGHRVLIDFEAVDYYTEAWVNSIHVGTHEGGYTLGKGKTRFAFA